MTATEESDVVVVGGGVMGLFTAYHAARSARQVTVIDAGSIGDPATASFGLTRSYRLDYLDPLYARLAAEAQRLWTDFEHDTASTALIRTGLLNVAVTAVTPDLDQTHAHRAHRVMTDLGFTSHLLSKDAAQERFPMLEADVVVAHPDAGIVDVGSVTTALRDALDRRGVRIIENTPVRDIHSHRGQVRVNLGGQTVTGRAAVITAGHGTNDVLATLPGAPRIPITKDRPREAKYYRPPQSIRHRYTAQNMPVLAYLDVGVYAHPIVEGIIDAVKIGFYDPPDLPRHDGAIGCVDDFVRHCLPELLRADAQPVTTVDQCDYDLVADDNFALGPVPGTTNVFLGVGWRGTGYKYAPVVGRILAQLACTGGTVYDVSRFSPTRFVVGAMA